MAHEAEVIDFFQPLEDEKNLFVSNIITKSLDEQELINCALHVAFSKFGLVYEIQVVRSRLRANLPSNHSFPSDVTTAVVNADCQTKKMEELKGRSSVHESKVTNSDSERYLWYAFVKLYSSKSVLEAKQALHLNAIVGLDKCKVNFAKRKKTLGAKNELQVRQCQDLANFYLGFHGWSSCVRVLKGEIIKPTTPDDTHRYRVVCVIDLIIRAYGLQTMGLGLFEDTYRPEEGCTFGSVVARCKKLAHQEALRKAFSTVLLVIIGSGKVYPEIDTVRQESIMSEASADILYFSSGQPSGKNSTIDGYNRGHPSCFVTQEDCGMWSNEKIRNSKK